MTNITKAEFDALPESLKPKFKAEGENYVLIEEDVEGLKKSKTEILAEKKRIQDEYDAAKKRLDEIDAQKSADDEERLKAAGEFAELETKLRAKITELETAHATEKTDLVNKFMREKLSNELTGKYGVKADRVRHALADLEDVEFSADDMANPFRIKGGIGDAKEFGARIEKLKTDSPWLFEANGASGSGASGSEGTGGKDTSNLTAEQKIATAYEQK